MSEWIRFDLGLPRAGRKTDSWSVIAKQGNNCLGEIKWYPFWRKYCFFPDLMTVFEEDCLRDIAQFCVDQTKAYRESKKNAERN